MIFNEICIAICGNFAIDSPETCDDGNIDNGDGCNATCFLEPGYQWNSTESEVYTVCGDSVRVGTEECDDGGTSDNDGCS